MTAEEVTEAAKTLKVLEEMVDKIGLSQVLDALAAICADKAEHMTVNWQDKEGASVWAHMSRRLDRVMTAAKNRGLK